MKLTHVELKNYRCFADTALIVDPYATVLMGPNDAGKSYLLRALTVFGARQNFANDDIRKVSAAGRSGQMEFTFEFSTFTDDEIAHLQRFGVELKPDDRLSLTRIGPRNADKPQVLLNGAILRETMRGNLAATPEPAASQEAADGNERASTEQPTEMAAADAPPSEGPVERAPISDAEWAAFLSEGLFPILPSIELLADLKPLPFEVNANQLAADDAEMETPRKLLQLGGANDLSLLSQDTAERHELLDNVSEEITKALREYWTQDTKIQLRVKASGDRVSFHILVRGDPAFTRPEWHSPAFREYIALLGTLLLHIEGREPPPILLLDEPGVRLHPRAQRDLVRLFRTLSQRTQLIYTAHYPYLIDRNFPGQLRLLEPKQHGTEINNKPYHVRGDSIAWEPIRTCLGLTVGDSLLFDDYNVIVEGITDQLLLCAISQELSKVRDDRALDLNYTAVLPAGGASQEADLAKRALAAELHVVALFDGEAARKNQINSFKKEFPNAPEPLWVGEFYKPGYDFSIEHMLPTELYLDAVNAFYQRMSDDYVRIDLDCVKGKTEGIVKVLEKLVPEAIQGRLGAAEPPKEDSDQEAPNTKELQSDRREIAESSHGDFQLAKVEVAKEAICLLRESGVQNRKGELRQEYERFAKLFAVIKKRFKL